MGQSSSRPFGYKLCAEPRKKRFSVRVLAFRRDDSRAVLDITVEARDEEVAKTEAIYLARTKHGFLTGKVLSVRLRHRFK